LKTERGARLWRAAAPVAVALAVALLPAPAGLAPHAWRYFAIFFGVILGLVLEPLAGAAVGLIGVAVTAVLAPAVLFSPEQLAQPGFRPAPAAVDWALSGFSDPTVWLIFGAYMFALGYEKTGLGRRIALGLVARLGRRTLTLGYAVALADLLLAPLTPSNTARSGGTIYPVIRNLPRLYGSLPNDPSRRRIGSYLMWVAIASNGAGATKLGRVVPGLCAGGVSAARVRAAGGVLGLSARGQERLGSPGLGRGRTPRDGPDYA
jgi:L-tartrate/succinate antiporter